MTLMFNLSEVFAMVIQMEDNAANFYRSAADLRSVRERGEAVFLEDLALMEQQHKEVFETMREAAAREGTSAAQELAPEGALYLAAIAGGYPVEGAPSVLGKFTGRESLADVLRLAIELEKKSILFYQELRELVPDQEDKERVTGIVAQERQHVVDLKRKLDSL
ncbi:MAG: ferritin-like domain-containing protein [Kiritimatiellia bacterium]